MSQRIDTSKSVTERRRLGAHYTPADLARSVVARALQPLMCWPHAMQCPCCIPSECIRNMIVIDPACGDGEFLVQARDLLAPLLHEALMAEDPSATLEEAIAIVTTECLVGVDVDPEAIAAASARLGVSCELVVADALFDWNFDTAGRPTAFVGNPPYLGGRRISTVHGKRYQQSLMKEWASANGGADLCAYFLLLAADTLDTGRSKGTMGFICTNTISQGDTRRAGLQWLLDEHHDVIYSADTNVPWPGDAAVTCSIVHLANEELWREIGERDAKGVEYAPWHATPPNNVRGLTRLQRPSREKCSPTRCARRAIPRPPSAYGPPPSTGTRCPRCAAPLGGQASTTTCAEGALHHGGAPVQLSLLT